MTILLSKVYIAPQNKISALYGIIFEIKIEVVTKMNQQTSYKHGPNLL